MIIDVWDKHSSELPQPYKADKKKCIAGRSPAIIRRANVESLAIPERTIVQHPFQACGALFSGFGTAPNSTSATTLMNMAIGTVCIVCNAESSMIALTAIPNIP